MKTTFNLRRLLSILLICIFVLMLFCNSTNTALIANADEGSLICGATINDAFTDNEILIVVKPAWNFTEYTTADFAEIGCVGIADLITDIEPNMLSRIIKLNLSVHSKQNVLDAIRLLEDREDIYCAEPNYILEALATPNDTQFTSGNQWAINKISLPAAWNITKGSNSVKVGVIDSGIYADHEDLESRVSTTLSRSYIASSSNALADSYGHGTRVAGIIGAKSNNQQGITGACWYVTLVSLRVSDAAGEYNYAGIIEAINYADIQAIPILNLSAQSFPKMPNASISLAIQGYDGLVVCSAGNHNNDNDGNPNYPSSLDLDNIISVGASTSNDTKASFSNYGDRSVDIFAPGHAILSTDKTGGYSEDNGTSYAAPYVAGVAALMLAECPGLTTAQIKEKILENADSISALASYCVCGGRLNAYKAVSNAHTYTNIGVQFVCIPCGHITTTPPN